MPAFAPASFEQPVVSPDTASLFRRTPYISPGEYRQTPTAVALKNLVPNGTEAEQEAALAAVIMRASDWVDTICFHRADGTLAASPSTESGWVRPKDNGSLFLVCNYKPILEVDGLAVGINPSEMQDIGQNAADTLTISGQIIQLPSVGGLGPSPTFPARRPSNGGKVYVAWRYINGFPHSSLGAEAKKGEEVLTVLPTEPGGTQMFGVYPGTQLTIHDGENTEVIVVESISGLTLNLQGPLLHDHALPAAPNATRVSSVPWIVEQATISLVSNLIKMRGTRAMVIPNSPAGATSPPRQADGQAGARNDYEQAVKMLEPFTVPSMVKS